MVMLGALIPPKSGVRSEGLAKKEAKCGGEESTGRKG